MLKVMTPLLGTKTPSALVGAKSGGDTRAARSLLSCALWRGMGRLWCGMGGGRPPHRQHGLSCSPAVRYFFWSEPGPPTMVFTKHETRITAFVAVRFSVGARGVASPETAVRTTAPPASQCFPVHHCSLLFTIVRHCSPLFSKKYCPAPVSSRRPVAAFLRVVARHGAAMARHGRWPSPAPAT